MGGIRRWGWRRPALVALAALALLIALFWYFTPSTGDVQARVAAAAARHRTAVLAPGDVPATLAEAVVATEDERFYQHHGIDVIGLARAFWYDSGHHCLCQGGSTITEQLAKDLYLGGSDHSLNKLQDMVLAIKIENTLDKQQILADYLTEIPTGPGLYGVQKASCSYFRRPLEQLHLAGYALLAGLTQAPSVYDPLRNPSAARARRHHVLLDMVANDFITPARARAADAQPILPPPGPGC